MKGLKQKWHSIRSIVILVLLFYLNIKGVMVRFHTWFPPLQHLQHPVFPLPPSSPLKSVPVYGADGDISLPPWTGSAELMPRPPMPLLQLQWLNLAEGELKRGERVKQVVVKGWRPVQCWLKALLG